jgi:hypothetical protein
MARQTSPLARCAAEIRADIKAAVKDGSLPPCPDGITFQVTQQTGAASTAIFIELLNAPRPWLLDSTPGVINRRSPEFARLHEALRQIAHRRLNAAGLPAAVYVQSDPETEKDPAHNAPARARDARGWPEEARIAAIKAIDRRTGPHLQITIPVTMYLATDILDAVAPLIRAAERERLRALADGGEGRGRLVRETWVETILELVPDPKRSWTTPYDELDELQRAADDRIGDTVAAAERERITAKTITRDELERAIVRLAEITGNRDSYYPALAGDVFRYAQDRRGET